MNANGILKYGHLTVRETVEGLPEVNWLTPGVCGVWSVKDIIAHLASFEHVLVDVLDSLLNHGSTPTLDLSILSTDTSVSIAPKSLCFEIS